MPRILAALGSTCARASFAAALALGPLLSAACGSHEEAQVAPVVAVKVARAELVDVRLTVRAAAIVHPRQQANLAARITSPIRELKARKGDRVAAGQVLALLDRRDVLAEREDAAAALRQAQQVRDRRTELYAEGAIPQRESLASETELAQAKARVELIQAQLRFTELASPFAGVITEQFLYPGDLAKPEAPIFTISDLAVVVARAQVPEAEAARVEPGQPGVFRPSDSSDGSFEGRVTVVSPAVDPARRTVEAWLEIQNPAGRIRAGAFGEVEILTGTTPRSVVVPREAVEFASGTRKGAVLVVDEAKIAHRRAVEGGELFDGKVQILQGLEPGELVVVEGGYGLPDATEVRLVEDGEP